jgi:secretion/DNA translocation related TadE-like protein
MRDDRGAGTVLVIVAMLLLTVATGVALAFVRIATAHARASGAADLAALAAARSGDCEQARRVADANDAVLVSCVAQGTDYQVVVAAGVPLMGRELRLPVTARAGY